APSVCRSQGTALGVRAGPARRPSVRRYFPFLLPRGEWVRPCCFLTATDCTRPTGRNRRERSGVRAGSARGPSVRRYFPSHLRGGGVRPCCLLPATVGARPRDGTGRSVGRVIGVSTSQRRTPPC